MNRDTIFVGIAILVALLAGQQMSKKGCPACLLTPNGFPSSPKTTPQPQPSNP